MLLIKRVYTKEFLRLLLITTGGLALSLSLIDLLDSMDDFLPHDPSAGKLLLYAALHMPKNIVYILPAGVLLSCLFIIGRASRMKELVAVMAAGGRVKDIFMPFIASGLLISAFAFLLGEMVSPQCLANAKKLKRAIMNKPQPQSFYSEGVMWFRAKDGSIVNIKLYLPDRDAFREMSVFRFADGRIEEVIQAEEAKYSGGTWVLGGVRRFNAASGEVKTAEELAYPQLGSPDVFKEGAPRSEHMGMFELRRYLRRLEDAGFRNLKLEVEMDSKVSFPVINLIMAIMGVSLAARRKIGGLAAMATGLLISLLYYFGFTTMLSQGYAGVVHPLVAVWTMPLLFGAAAVYLFARIPE